MRKTKGKKPTATASLRVSRFYMKHADMLRVMKEFKAAGFTRLAATRVKANGCYTKLWRLSAVVEDIAAFARWLSVEAQRDSIKAKETV